MEIVLGIVILLTIIGIIVGIINVIIGHKKGFAILATVGLGIFLIYKFGGSIIAIIGTIVAIVVELIFARGGDD